MNDKKIIPFKDLKKGDIITSNQLGVPCEGVLMESVNQGRGLKTTILIDAKGSQIGMFDEMGSIYSWQILEVKRGNEWFDVAHKPNPKILKTQIMNNVLFGD